MHICIYFFTRQLIYIVVKHELNIIFQNVPLSHLSSPFSSTLSSTLSSLLSSPLSPTLSPSTHTKLHIIPSLVPIFTGLLLVIETCATSFPMSYTLVRGTDSGGCREDVFSTGELRSRTPGHQGWRANQQPQKGGWRVVYLGRGTVVTLSLNIYFFPLCPPLHNHTLPYTTTPSPTPLHPPLHHHTLPYTTIH